MSNQKYIPAKSVRFPLNEARLRLFMIAVLLAALWIGMNLLFPRMEPTGIPTIITRALIESFILLGLWFALVRAGFSYRARVTIWTVVATILALWFVLIAVLATHGAFRVVAQDTRAFPAVPIAIFLPPILVLTIMTRSRKVASLLDATPAHWLVGLQLYRILGGFFLVNWWHGVSHGLFALPAGIGDVATGLMALPVAAMVASGTAAGRRAGRMWNIFGLLDLGTAIVLGVLTSPGGPLGGTVPAPASAELGTFPTVMTPAFSVPISIILHGLSIWQLRRQGRK